MAQRGKKSFSRQELFVILSIILQARMKLVPREFLTSETSLITENYVKSRKGDWILFNDPV